MKCLVIAVYLGPLPALMPLWLRSAAANPEIDFLVASDQPAPSGLPANVRFQSVDLASLRAVWSAAAGFEVALHHPYKLNDFKPLFWMLATDLDRYDYWGYCDLDLLFGDLTILTGGRLGQYAMIGSEGHFRLLRNEEATRRAWTRITAPRTWQSILTDPANFGMDEHHGINQVFTAAGMSWFSDPARIADIDPGFRQYRLLPWLRNYRYQAFFWDNGRIRREAVVQGQARIEEFAYLHLQKRKLAIDPLVLDAQTFNIDPGGITPRGAAGGDAASLAARNPARFPTPGEARILLRELRRRLTGTAPPIRLIDQAAPMDSA